MKYRIVDSLTGTQLRQRSQKPLIIVATGAAFGPVRYLLELQTVEIRKAVSNNGQSKPVTGRLSIFLGLHPTDVPSTQKVLDKTKSLGLVDMLEIIQSNQNERRIQGKPQQGYVASHIETKVKKDGASMFVCANEEVAKSIKAATRAVLGSASEQIIMSKRYIEEEF